MSSTSSLQKISKIEISKKSSNSNNASTSQQKINSPKKIKLTMPEDNSLNSDLDDDDDEEEEEEEASEEVEEDECVIVEEKTQQRHRITNAKTSKLPNPYAEQNATLAREVTKYRELAQLKEMRIQEMDTENFKLREYVVTVEEFAYSQKEYFERAEKRVSELEAILSSRVENNNNNNNNNNESHNQTNEETLNESEERIFDINNPISVELLKCLEKKMAPLKKFANRVDSALNRITNGTQNEEEQETTTTTPNRISFASKTSLKRRQSSLTATKSQRRSSSLSSTENSSTMLSEDDITLVTKSISPNTMRLFASNSIKSNETANSTTPTSSLVLNQGQVSNKDIEENVNLLDTRNLNACMSTFENAPLGLGTLIEENEEMDEDATKIDATAVKEKSTNAIKPLENYEDEDEEEEEEEEEEESASSDEEDENLDENIIIEEEVGEPIELIDETQELTSSEKKSENVSMKSDFFKTYFYVFKFSDQF
jgi:hypothetical protein